MSGSRAREGTDLDRVPLHQYGDFRVPGAGGGFDRDRDDHRLADQWAGAVPHHLLLLRRARRGDLSGDVGKIAWPKNTRRPNRGRDGGGGERRKEKGVQLNLGRRRDSFQLAYAYGGPEACQSRRTSSSCPMLPRYIRNSPADGSQSPPRTLPPQLQWGCPPARSWMRTRILPILASRSTSRWK